MGDTLIRISLQVKLDFGRAYRSSALYVLRSVNFCSTKVTFREAQSKGWSIFVTLHHTKIPDVRSIEGLISFERDFNSFEHDSAVSLSFISFF
jgi:hypothetical protein